MRKICLALAGFALAVGTPALAVTIIGGPFKNYGDCNSRLSWWANSQRWGKIEDWGTLKRYVGYDVYCFERDDKWYIAHD